MAFCSGDVLQKSEVHTGLPIRDAKLTPFWPVGGARTAWRWYGFFVVRVPDTW